MFYHTHSCFDLPDKKISEIELIAVEKDSGDVAQDEDTDNTNQDEGKIYLSSDRAVGPQVRKPENNSEKIIISCKKKSCCAVLPDSSENLGIEDNESQDRDDDSEDNSGVVYIVPGIENILSGVTS